MKILAIETSCDETSVAILEVGGSKRDPRFRVPSHIISSQVKLHTKFGGVVPNLARREHEKNLVPILVQALKESALYKRAPQGTASVQQQEEIAAMLEREQDLLVHFKKTIMPLVIPDIDMIAVTYGPGLAPALWVGVNFAKALASFWNKPLIPVNHMAGHFYSALVGPKNSKTPYPVSYTLNPIRFPALTLLVSGAHTELVLVKKHGDFRILGSTLDDAAGEAFDKVARMLGLGYPGGPAISDAAEMKSQIPNDKLEIKFPRPMINSKNYDFSFSGLKTAVLYFIRGVENIHSVNPALCRSKCWVKKLRPAIAREFQNAVVDVLVAKTVRAAKEYNVKMVTLGGGVAANAALRGRLAAAIKQELPGVPLIIPELSLTGDNALMIALAAHFCGKKISPDKVQADANVIL